MLAQQASERRTLAVVVGLHTVVEGPQDQRPASARKSMSLTARNHFRWFPRSRLILLQKLVPSQHTTSTLQFSQTRYLFWLFERKTHWKSGNRWNRKPVVISIPQEFWHLRHYGRRCLPFLSFSLLSVFTFARAVSQTLQWNLNQVIRKGLLDLAQPNKCVHKVLNRGTSFGTKNSDWSLLQSQQKSNFSNLRSSGKEVCIRWIHLSLSILRFGKQLVVICCHWSLGFCSGSLQKMTYSVQEFRTLSLIANRNKPPIWRSMPVEINFQWNPLNIAKLGQ